MRLALFVLASVLVAALIVVLWRVPDGLEFVRALLANFALVTWSSFVLPLRGLPRFESWYRLRRWERSGRFFTCLGVPLFRTLVRRTPLSRFNRALPSAWHSGDPERMEEETRTAEAAHLVAFFLVLALAACALFARHAHWAVWLAVLDVPLNLYPVLLQRDHRHRLFEMVRRGELEHP